MDVATARSVLGVPASASRDEVRAAYRARLRAAHPDLHGRDAGTAEVVAAYRVLRDVDPEPEVTVVVDGDTVVADLPAGDLFALLVEAGDAIGEVTDVDASAGVLEVVVEVDGHGACAVVWSLGSHGRAWCTVEPLVDGPAPPVEAVAALLADGLRRVTAP